MAVALGLLAGAEAQTDDASRLNELLVDGDAVVRWGAAVALVRLLPQAPPEPAVRELLGWLTSEAAPERDPEILFCDPQDYALLVVRSVPVLRERAVGRSLIGSPLCLAQPPFHRVGPGAACLRSGPSAARGGVRGAACAAAAGAAGPGGHARTLAG
jgi:hypothetical protein